MLAQVCGTKCIGQTRSKCTHVSKWASFQIAQVENTHNFSGKIFDSTIKNIVNDCDTLKYLEKL